MINLNRILPEYLEYKTGHVATTTKFTIYFYWYYSRLFDNILPQFDCIDLKVFQGIAYWTVGNVSMSFMYDLR